MRQYGIGGKWMMRLTVAALLLGITPMPTANSNSTPHPIAVLLVDDNDGLITNVKLSARYASSGTARHHGETGKTGKVNMILPPGRYYFTGNLSQLHSNQEYNKFKNNHNMMFYYISEPFEITEQTREIRLTISNENYIDIADIAGAKEYKLHISQIELGIHSDVHVHSRFNGLRLFMPMHKIYDFSNEECGLHLQWPVYAAPGLLYIFSAS